MKKILSLAFLASALMIAAGCTSFDPVSPIDTRATQSGGISGGDVPADAFSDSASGLHSRGGFNTEGRDWNNIDPADIVETVYFGFDQYAIPESERAKVQKAARHLSENPDLKVALVAHTDWYGTEEYNLVLSDKRGASVQEYLGQYGAGPDRSEVVAMGKNGAALDVSKDSPEAKHDRRVEIVRLN